MEGLISTYGRMRHRDDLAHNEEPRDLQLPLPTNHTQEHPIGKYTVFNWIDSGRSFQDLQNSISIRKNAHTQISSKGESLILQWTAKTFEIWTVLISSMGEKRSPQINRIEINTVYIPMQSFNYSKLKMGITKTRNWIQTSIKAKAEKGRR